MKQAAIRIDSHDQATSEWLAFASDVSFGQGASRYQRRQLPRQVARFNAPQFLSAFLDDRLVGIYVLDRRLLRIRGRRVPGVYRALLAVTDEYRGRGVGRALAHHAMTWIDDQAVNGPLLSFGCIDVDNTASLATLQRHGGQCIGRLVSRLLYRQWPTRSSRFRLMPGHVEPDVADEPSAGVTVADITPSRLTPVCLGEPASPLVMARVGLGSVSITGASVGTELAVRLLVRPWPALRRRFDPGALAYLRISHLQIAGDRTALFAEFLEAVLAHVQVHYALLVLDPASELYRRLAASGVFDVGIGPRFLPPPQHLQVIGCWHPRSATGPLPAIEADRDRVDLPPVDL